MKKLFILLTMVAMLATACSESGVDNTNDDPQPPVEQPDDNNDTIEYSLSVSQDQMEVNYKGQEHRVTVAANCSWVASCSAEWVELLVTEGGDGERYLKFTVERNTSLEARTATIVVNSEEHNLTEDVEVTQTAFAPVFEVSESISLVGKACDEILGVKADIEFNASDDADWLTCEVVEEGVKLSATANTTSTDRSAIVTLTAVENESVTKQVAVVQVSGAYYLYYKSTDGGVVTPSNPDAFGANIVDNVCSGSDKQGVITFDAPISSIGEEAFAGCKNLYSITLPEGVISIGNSAFEDCTRLIEAVVPNSVVTIGDNAFYDCYNLVTMSFGSGVTSIGDNAFYDCGFEELDIPSSVQTIGDYAFQECYCMVSLTIGDGITMIGEGAFCDCAELAEIYCKASTPPALGPDALEGLASDFKVYVPTDSVEQYKSDYSWQNYADNIEGYNFKK